MRATKVLVAALAGAVIGASAAAADEPGKLIFGSLSSLTIGSRDVDSTDTSQGGSGQSWEFNSTSAYNIPIWKSVSIQFDTLSDYNLSPSNSDFASSNAVGLHLSYRNPNQGLIGLFGAYSWTKIKAGDGGSGVGGGTQFDMAMIGAEAQLYMGSWTFYLQGGYADVTKENDVEQEGFNKGWFTRGVVRYFFNPNTKLEAEVSYAKANPYIDGGPGGAADNKGQFTAWGISFDHKLGNVLNYPVYGTLGYSGAYYDAVGEDHLTEHVFKAGIKIMLGSRDLLQNDRAGATLSLPTLPIRANAMSQNVD